VRLFLPNKWIELSQVHKILRVYVPLRPKLFIDSKRLSGWLCSATQLEETCDTWKEPSNQRLQVDIRAWFFYVA
jgi:hypothetical protein